MSVSVEDFLQSCGVSENSLEHGDWKKHKYISKHPSKKSGKMVYKYPDDSKDEDDSGSGFTIGRTNKQIIEQKVGITGQSGDYNYNTKSYHINSPETNAVNSGRSGRDFLANFLEDAADTIRPKKK